MCYAPNIAVCQRAHQALRSLGDSAEAVAESLRELKITGESRSTNCPLANFLRELFPVHDWISVGARHAQLEANGGIKRHIDIGLPEPCVEFVREFDGKRIRL